MDLNSQKTENLKIIIDKQELSSVLKIATTIVTANNINPLLEEVVLDANKESNTLKITFLNEIIQVQYIINKQLNIMLGGRISVKLKYLDAIISKVSNGEIILEKIDSNSLMITKGDFQSNINLNNSYFDVSSFDLNPEWKCLSFSKKFLAEIERKLFHTCVPKIEKITPLNGIYFDSTTFEDKICFSSTDSYRASMIMKSFNGVKVKVIMEQQTIHFINAYTTENDDIHLYFNDDKVYAKWDQFVVVAKLIDGTFPNLYNVFTKKDNTNSFITTASNFHEVVERGYYIVNNQKSPLVEIQLINGEMEIKYKSTNIGSSFEKMKISEFTGTDYQLTLNPKFLLACLKAFEGHNVIIEYLGKNQPLMFYDLDDDSFKQLILPIRFN